MIKYFISYQHQVNDSEMRGFGMLEIETENKIRSFEHIMDIRKKIQARIEREQGLKVSVIILNFIEL